jgi:2-keto-4-pentenoate hydratase
VYPPFRIGKGKNRGGSVPELDDVTPTTARGRLFIRLASRLWHAETEARAARPLRDDAPDLTVADAYAIRAEVDALRMVHGSIPVGRKIGLSARELQAIAGADEPFWAYIFNDGDLTPSPPTTSEERTSPTPGHWSLVTGHSVTGHSVINLSRYMFPRVEPEIAITLRHDLDGPIISPGDIAAAVGAIQPSFELIDARTSAPGFNVVDLVADSGANAGFILGDPIPVNGFDLADLARVSVQVRSHLDPSLDRSGDATALMDGPLGCLLWLARHTLARGEPLRAGEIILTGTMAGAIPLRPGDTLTVAFSGLGAEPMTLAVAGE